MAITITELGLNSARLVYSAGETLANMRSAVGGWLAAHGWEVHDAEYFVYKANCKTRTNIYKYIQIFVNGNYLYFRVYQDWNAVTHVGTNEVVYKYTLEQIAGYSVVAGTAVALGLVSTTEEGNIYLYATARYAMMNMVSRLNVTQTQLAGVIEWYEDGLEYDINGVPFGWTTINGLMGLYTGSRTATPFYYPTQVFPPVSFGNTGINAMTQLMTSVGTISDEGNLGNSSTFSQSPTPSSTSYPYPLAKLLPATNQAMTNLPRSYNIEIAKSRFSGVATMYIVCPEYVLGKVYGIKCMAGAIGAWQDNDKVDVLCGPELFQDPKGQLTRHSVIKSALSNVALLMPE